MNENKRFAINMFANLIAFGVQFIINIVLTPYITETLGSDAYAFVPLSNNIASYATIITIAISSMASRFISIEFNRGNMEETNIYFNSVLVANIILAVFLTIPSVLLVIFSHKIFEIPSGMELDVKITLGFALASMLLSVFFSVYSNVYFIKNRIDVRATNEIWGNIIRVVVLLLCFGLLRPHIYYITGATFFLTFLYGLFNFYYTKKLLPELSFDLTKFRKKAIFILLSSGIWNSVNHLSTVLLSTLDLFLANVLIGADESGIYAVAKTVPNFIASLISVVVSVFVPQFTIFYAQKKKKELIENINFSIKFLGGTMTLPIAFLMVFGAEFFKIWVPSENSELLQGLSVITLIPSVVSGGINTLFNVFTVTNKLKIPSVVLLISGVLNTLLTSVLLKYTELGVFAIPIVSCVILLIKNLTFTPMYAAYCLNEKKSVFYLPIIKGVACTMFMVIVCSVYKMFIFVETWGDLFIAATICSMISIGFNFLLIFNQEEKRKVFSYVKKRVKVKNGVRLR